MRKISRSSRCWLAIGIWALGLLVFFALGWWNVVSFRTDAENRLIGEAGRVAAQLANLLAISGTRLEPAAARSLAQAAMEDERVYAVKVDGRSGLLAGQRRNYLWEPIAWDEEINENCVQGMNPVRIGGKQEGKVEVWLSPRLDAEENGIFQEREGIRFLVIASLWTAILCLLLWYWGDFRRLARAVKKGSDEEDGAASHSDAVLMNLAPAQEDGTCKKQETSVVSAAAAYAYQRKNPDAWLVTAALFRQTFSRAPQLLNRLYADGELAGLCHLGRMLEMAAPCIGAVPLQTAARDMQAALNDPGCELRATPVEECAAMLEKTLAALGGENSSENRQG